MKKIFAKIGAFTMALLLVFSLAACNDGNGGNNSDSGNGGSSTGTQTGGGSQGGNSGEQGGSSGEQGGGGSQGGNSGEQGGGSDTDSQKGEKLPEENFEAAWAAAFDESNFDNFKMTVKIKTTYMNETAEETLVLTRVGESEHVVGIAQNEKSEHYYDGEMYYEQDEDGTWGTYLEPGGALFPGILQGLQYNYANAGSAEYLEEEGGYAFPVGSSDAPIRTDIIYFKGGRLHGLKISSERREMHVETSYSFIYGGQTVTLPEVKDPPKKLAKLTVWAPENQQTILAMQVETFKEMYPKYSEVEFKLGICGDGNAYSQMSIDPMSGADVFAYANDQLINLQKIGALSRIAPTVVDRIRETDFEPALESGAIDGKYYGYPYSDNGFFLYYDKSIISPEEAKDLESVVAACERAHKKFFFEYTDPWYALSMAFGAGGKYEVEYGGITGTELISLKTNFDQKPEGSKYSYAALAGMELNDLSQEHALTVIGSDCEWQIGASLQDETFGACIRGVWEAANIENHLGENYAATALPKWTDIEGNAHDMATFAGYKLWGVNAYSKNLELAHKFAAFLASEAQQKLRYEYTGADPTDLALRETDEIKNDQAVQALYASIEQSSVLQASFPGSYWKAAEKFVNDATRWYLDEMSDADIEDRVKNLVDELTAM